ncbi:MAG: hypothetical protein KGJ01_02480 [Patescibacteria group bacterium]|nr:hypothetical protein [Patescibacteria group bacterium]
MENFQISGSNNGNPQAGQSAEFNLKNTGICHNLVLTLEGTIVVATAAATTTDKFPYGIVNNVNLAVGAQSKLINLTGTQVNAYRSIRHPGYIEEVDIIPGGIANIGNPGQNLAIGTYNFLLTYEVPVVVDEVSMIGSLYLNSKSVTATLEWTRGNDTDIITPGGGGSAVVTITNVYCTQYTGSAPSQSDGKGGSIQVLPDLSRLHSVNSFPFPLTGLGDTRISIPKQEGLLQRLLIEARYSPTGRLSPIVPSSAVNALTDFNFGYGGNKIPKQYTPIQVLAAENNAAYGRVLPYDMFVMDTLVADPVRDAINMVNLTEIAVTIGVGNNVVLNQGTVNIVEEVLL